MRAAATEKRKPRARATAKPLKTTADERSRPASGFSRRMYANVAWIERGITLQLATLAAWITTTGAPSRAAASEGQGLSGPAKAELSAAQAAAAVMPPFCWARPVTPREAEGWAVGVAEGWLPDADADGWAADVAEGWLPDADADGWAAGVAEGWILTLDGLVVSG